MASVYIASDPYSNIEYSIGTGKVRQFVLRGKTLYDEQKGISEDGWEEKLVELVREQGMDLDPNGRGLLHAFVYKLQEDGLL